MNNYFKAYICWYIFSDKDIVLHILSFCKQCNLVNKEFRMQIHDSISINITNMYLLFFSKQDIFQTKLCKVYCSEIVYLRLDRLIILQTNKKQKHALCAKSKMKDMYSYLVLMNLEPLLVFKRPFWRFPEQYARVSNIQIS